MLIYTFVRQQPAIAQPQATSGTVETTGTRKRRGTVTAAVEPQPAKPVNATKKKATRGASRAVEASGSSNNGVDVDVESDGDGPRKSKRKGKSKVVAAEEEDHALDDVPRPQVTRPRASARRGRGSARP